MLVKLKQSIKDPKENQKLNYPSSTAVKSGSTIQN